MATIQNNLQAVKTRIAAACKASGRPESAVQLVAVSKTHPAEAVRAAAAAGQRDFGENYVQEALTKIEVLADLPLVWHFIGPIQSNKTRAVAEAFHWVHSLDREKIANRLSESRPPHLPPLKVCIEVNLSGEASKSGAAPEAVAPLARQVIALPRLQLRGLMAIPEPTLDSQLQRRRFRALRELKDELVRGGLALDTLSMGMSADLEAAIAEGSTMVRVGTAIFGERGEGVNITFIGGGNMARAIVGGLLSRGYTPDAIGVVEVIPEARERLQRELGVRCFGSPGEAAPLGDLLVMAVKPQQMRAAAAQVVPQLSGQLVVSIAAGTRLADLSRWLGGHRLLVRCMPNTPALIGAGVTAAYAAPQVSAAQRARAAQVLEAVGKVLWVDDEGLLDPVTAVSGSGPAYVFYFIEAMQQAAVELGLSKDQARTLSLETFLGAARLAAGSPDPASVLRERVTSRGGTTEAALASMAADQVREAIVRAIRAASERGRQLGEELGRD